MSYIDTMKKTIRILSIYLIAIPTLLQAASPGANPLTSLQQAGQLAYGANAPTDIKILIGRLVQILLGFVGILFIVLIIIGGMQWMLSGGNEKKIDEAKKRITNATIGLVIVVAAYSIAFSVTKYLSQAAS